MVVRLVSSVESVNRVLMTLPDGTRVATVLLTDHTPPEHIYRVISPTGATLCDYPTLSQLAAFLNPQPQD